jgi:hypothetical protein
MADKKISALTSATTPLAGTEVLPIVQSGSTVKVPVANLTSGRAVDMLSLTADTTTLVVDSTNHRTGVGTATPSKKLNVVIDAVSGRQNLDNVDRTSQNLLTFTNPQYSTDASMGMVFRSFPESDSRQGAGIFASGGGSNNYTDLNLFVSGLGGAATSYSAIYIEGLAGDVTVRKGNLVVGTSGKGIDFSATPGTGTSELLADYEEGTWTPVDGSGAGLVLTVANASYTKVGRLVEASFAITYPVTASGSTLRIGGLPFTAKAFGTSMNTVSFSVVQYAIPITCVVDANATTFTPLTYGAGTLTNANMSGLILRGTAIYEV